MFSLGNDWDKLLGEEFSKDYYIELREFLKTEYSTRRIYPPMNDIYNALRYTTYKDARVVILGQDPYHGPGQAHGLCFSVKKGVAPPPSLQNIFKEIKSDTGIDNLGKHGQLTKWAESGVLLLNAVLTVQAGNAGSHRGKGWEILTDRIIEKLNERPEPIVFILWGAFAKSKQALITGSHHCVLTAAHPSPLSAYNGFFGCRHFSRTNEFLRSNGLPEIDWSIGE